MRSVAGGERAISSRRSPSLLTISGIAAASATSQGVAPATEIAMDVGTTIGPLKPLNGVDGAPDLTFLPAGSRFSLLVTPVDRSVLCRGAHVDLVGAHDVQVFAISTRISPPYPPPSSPGPLPFYQAMETARDLNGRFPDPSPA